MDAEIALRHLPFAGIHHLLVFTVAVIWWMRREKVGRLLSAYMVLAFATAALALHSYPAWWLTGGLMSGAFAVVWLREVIHPSFHMSFERTPRFRLVLMMVAAGFAIVYPGHSGDLPGFIFSPLGVALQPTLLLALAVLNSVTPVAGRPLRWTHAIAGIGYGVAGVTAALSLGAAAVAAPIALVLTSCYTVVLLIAGTNETDADKVPRAVSVEQLRARMYQRRTLLPGPRDPRRRTRRVKRRL